MVMHARKTQRISDGYFEKHQTHPYQNSKYNSTKSSYDARYNHERIRESPNGNSFRSDSPDSESPRDRSYQSKNSYSMQKIREKERENRDYKSREKYSDCARSPKEKRSRESRDSEHRTNHDRSSSEIGNEKAIVHPLKLAGQNASLRDSSQRKPLHNSCQEKREERERVLPARVGDWTEHISSSGKKYYYNCKTEVSQWEKPREWIERERSRDKPRDRDGDRSYSSSSRTHDKHSNSRASMSNSRDQPSKLIPRSVEKRDMYWNNQSSGSRDDGDTHDRRKHLDSQYDRPNQAPRLTIKEEFPCESQTQDMDISPGDSTPTSEASYSGSSHHHQGVQEVASGPVLLATALPRLQSHPPRSTYQPVKESPSPTPTMIPPPHTVVSANVPGPPVTLASLPRLLAQIGGGTKMEQSDLSTQKALQQIQTILSRQTSMEPGNGPSVLNNLHPGSQTNLQQPLKVDTSNPSVSGEGPPTPTHSENQDCIDARKLTEPPSNLSSLHNLSQAGTCSSLNALRTQGPYLTPSLANHYRDDLVNHVRGWPAEVIEKQVQKVSEEGNILGNIQCTRVSAELKIARAVVRQTEIQATLQEQRKLFLRQQIQMLEEMKSQNSFMADDAS